MPIQATSSRADSLPQDVSIVLPAQDDHKPLMHVEGWLDPVPLEGTVNTAGAEDSPFITSDGTTLLFFFTPDVRVPVEKQLLDGVTGIYHSEWLNGTWSEPERVFLQEAGKLALDGCGFSDGETLWFCTAREGLTGLHWFKADREGNRWVNWRLADFDPSYEVGELHMHEGDLYFHSKRAGGRGDLDIWMSRKVGDKWGFPENLRVLNTEVAEGYPFLTADGQELWFTRWYQGTPAVYRSTLVDGEWSEPQLVISQFAGEPTLDPEGNIYFVHHYYRDGQMIEADIYVAYRK
jgi:hypothetical protein